MKKPVGRLLYPNTGWYFAAMLLFTAAAAAVGQYILAGGALFVTLIMFIISRARLSRRKRQLMSYVQTATDSVGISVHAGSAFPMAVIRLPENEIIWGNPSFFTITGLSDTACYQTLDAVVPGFSTSWLREGRSELPGDQIIGGRRYRIYGNYVKSEDDATTVQLATIYFADMTEMFNVRDEFLRTRPIVSIILIDNYDELTANLSDSAISTLDAQLNDVVANWTAGLEALCRKIERNRYLLIFESKDLARLQDGRFSILEDVRHVTTSGGMSATISLGIGKDGGSFAENYRFASLAIEMSLSRGGDQAVIKDRFNFTFYGGRTKEAERHTRVKSRVMAGSLSELIGQSSTVYIMGHRMADLDALGSAVGLLCLCRVKERPARIVIDLQKKRLPEPDRRAQGRARLRGSVHLRTGCPGRGGQPEPAHRRRHQPAGAGRVPPAARVHFPRRGHRPPPPGGGLYRAAGPQSARAVCILRVGACNGASAVRRQPARRPSARGAGAAGRYRAGYEKFLRPHRLAHV